MDYPWLCHTPVVPVLWQFAQVPVSRQQVFGNIQGNRTTDLFLFLRLPFFLYFLQFPHELGSLILLVIAESVSLVELLNVDKMPTSLPRYCHCQTQ
jgi:hypothetical protein